MQSRVRFCSCAYYSNPCLFDRLLLALFVSICFSLSLPLPGIYVRLLAALDAVLPLIQPGLFSDTHAYVWVFFPSTIAFYSCCCHCCCPVSVISLYGNMKLSSSPKIRRNIIIISVIKCRIFFRWHLGFTYCVCLCGAFLKWFVYYLDSGSNQK